MALLGQNSLQVQLNTLECLEAFTRRYIDQFRTKVGVISEAIAHCITDHDMSRTYLALKVASNLVKSSGVSALHSMTVKAAIKSVSNDQVTGSSLDALIEFFTLCAKNHIIDNVTVQSIMDTVSLKSQQSALLLALIAKGDSEHQTLKNQFFSLVNETQAKYQIIGALCLGEYGKLVDLSTEKGLFEKIQSFFNSSSEEVRHAASISLGKITIGNSYFFLNKVMEMINNSDSKHKYLFLNTIREIILNNSEALQNDVEVLAELLLEQSTHDEESIRSIVAESLGRLFNAWPAEMIDCLSEGIKDGST